MPVWATILLQYPLSTVLAKRYLCDLETQLGD